MSRAEELVLIMQSHDEIYFVNDGDVGDWGCQDQAGPSWSEEVVQWYPAESIRDGCTSVHGDATTWMGLETEREPVAQKNAGIREELNYRLAR